MTTVNIARSAPAAFPPIAPRHSLVASFLMALIRAYQLAVSPAQLFLFGPTGGCRFTPTCSQYAMDALRARGALAGSWLAAKRICRCHPLGNCGHDPVPGTDGKRVAADVAKI